VISENCLQSTTNMFVFDEKVNHVKQNTNMFKLFNLLKLRLKITVWNTRYSLAAQHLQQNYQDEKTF